MCDIVSRQGTLGQREKVDRSSVAWLGSHEYLYMETSCATRKTPLTHITLIWKDILKSWKP